MRRADQLLKTMTALRDCLDECRRDTSPLAALEKRLQELRLNLDFTSADITQIETAARCALAACPPATSVAADRHSANLVNAHC